MDIAWEAEEPFVTVVMPVYNGERHLRETLERFTQMAYCRMELILVDDGSTDAGGAICREYEAMDERIRYIRQSNRGIAASRNRGIELARGEYIGFWDQDDIVIPEGYFALLHKIQSEHAQMGMCGTGRLIGDKMSDFEKLRNGVCSDDEVRTQLLYPILFRGYRYPFADAENYIYGSVWKCIFRTDFVRDNHIRFRRFINYEDDWIFVTRALCFADKAVTVSDTGYCWRVNDASESHRGTYIGDLPDKFDALDRYVLDYLSQGIKSKKILAEYNNVTMCEHYIDLYRNASNVHGTAHISSAQDTGGDMSDSRKCRRQIREYLLRTDYRKRIACRKYLKSSAYRRRVVLASLRYGGIASTYIISRCYDRLEEGLSRIQWIVRLERRRKMKQDREASDETHHSDTVL